MEENKEYKGDLKGYPTEIVEKMLERQMKQGNPRDISIFEKDIWANQKDGGFTWDNTIDGSKFWYDIIQYKRFDTFYKKYPKKKKLYYYSIGNFTPLLEKGGVNLLNLLSPADGMFYVPINGGIIMWTSYSNEFPNEITKFIKKNGIDLTPDEEILDKVEKEYLSAVIKPFNIQCIIKRHAFTKDECLIELWLKDGRTAQLPRFKNPNMYKGMKLNKEYTLEELGL